MKERFPRYPRAASDREAIGRPARDRIEMIIAIENSFRNAFDLFKKRGEPVVIAELYGLVDTLRDLFEINPKTIHVLKGEFKYSGNKIVDDPSNVVQKEERAEERERHEVS